MHIFCDWISIRQEYPDGGLPVIADGHILFLDSDGCVTSDVTRGQQLQGSWESSVRVRCDGYLLEFSGNSLRFGRPDNVLGRGGVLEAYAAANKILREAGLPEFVDDCPTYARSCLTARGQVRGSFRPRITRVDLTANYAAGSAWPSVLGWAASQGLRRYQPYRYPNGATVEWGRGSRRAYAKLYVKAHDVRRSVRRCRDLDHLAWLERLADWCDSVGLLRFEVSFKSLFLRDHGLDDPAAWSSHVANNLFSDWNVFSREVNVMQSAQDMVDLLIERGYGDRFSRQCVLYIDMWRRGMDVARLLPDRTFRRYRQAARLLGVDLAVAPSASAIQVVPRLVELSEPEYPAWLSSAA